MPTCWIIAGPNGAGKTTFALEYLPQIAQCRRFINADLIAAGLSPLAPDRELFTASRLFLREIESRIEQRENFAFETTLSGRSYLKLVRRLRTEDWRVELIYLALPSAEMSRSLANLFDVFSVEVDICRCFMNNNQMPELVFEQQGEFRTIINNNYYQNLITLKNTTP